MDKAMTDDDPVTPAEHEPYEADTEGFGGGHIRARHGRVNRWLLVVYLALFAWGVYYAILYWGGLGPGLDLTI
jgi:hypothetical protein